MKLAAFFMSAVLVGQVPTSLNFGSPAVSAPIPSATAVGATGFTNTFYWVVARTPGGYSSPGAAIATNTVGSANFSVSNYVVISWPAISGATGYDVIRSDSPSYPASTSCASCAVALNQAGTSFSDQGGATSAYSGGAQSVATQAIFTLDNVTVATPQINVQILNSRQNVTFALPSTGVGTVTSVGLSLPGIFTVSGSPVTTTGTLTGTLATQTANTIWAGPTTGAAAAPTFRALVAADMPAGVIPTGNAVGGASNLATVGAVPYVSSSGVLNQDASNFFWDSSNHRLGIGTNSPSTFLEIRQAGAVSMRLNNSSSGTAIDLVSDAGGVPRILVPASTPLRFDYGTNATRLTVGNSVGIGPSNTSPTGTLSVYDATASTGVTTLTVKAGAGQSTTNLQEWQNSSGTVLAKVTSAGKFIAPLGSAAAPAISFLGDATTGFYSLGGGAGNASFANAGSNTFLFGANTGNGTYPWSFRLRNNVILGWSSGVPDASVDDTSLSRVSAGVVGVGTGAAGSTAGTLQAAVLKVDGSAGTGITFTTDNVADIGASGGSRPRNVYIGGSATLGASGAFGWSTRGSFVANANGVFAVADSTGADFGRLQFGGTTSSFPSLKRSTTGLIARLADDSADTWVKTLYVQTNVVAVASLPACNAGLEGSHYGVNNALAPTALATVVGGGAVHVSVYCDGTNWIVN